MGIAKKKDATPALIPQKIFEVKSKSLNPIPIEKVLERLRVFAFNSSHFVWMISDFTFYETSNGWIFAISEHFGVNLVALEPLPPNHDFIDQDFLDAVIEIQENLSEGAIAFISIGERFSSLLNKINYYSLQFGNEPWVDLSDFEPKGKRDRGLRAARNQALKAGLQVEMKKLSDVINDPGLKKQVDALHRSWITETFLSLEGFLLKSDPWKLMDDRLCFIAKTPDNIISGVLLASPISLESSWYFEDMWLSPARPKGAGEFLTLEAMGFLHAKGAKRVSLGVIPFNGLGFNHNSESVGFAKPLLFAACLKIFSSLLKIFYNAEGLNLFRKRFRVQVWSPTFMSVRTSPSNKRIRSFQWIQVIIGLMIAHRPRFYFRALGRRALVVPEVSSSSEE